MIRLVTRFTARDTEAALRLSRLLLRLKESVTAEPGNTSYDVFGSVEDPIRFFCLEAWESQHHADRHRVRNDEAGVTSEAAPLLAVDPETSTLDPLETTDREPS